MSDTATEQQQDHLTGLNTSSEEDVWNEIVGQVVDLVVLAMKNFSASKAIMNRACLVLNNLSLHHKPRCNDCHTNRYIVLLHLSFHVDLSTTATQFS